MPQQNSEKLEIYKNSTHNVKTKDMFRSAKVYTYTCTRQSNAFSRLFTFRHCFVGSHKRADKESLQAAQFEVPSR